MGVFATVNSGVINNYGLIEHADKDAKTYITNNEDATGFNNVFNKSTNRIGRINLPYSNKDEDNVSISGWGYAAGFVSITVSTEGGSAPSDGNLDLTTVGYYVNYCIIKSGVSKITKVSNQITYLEFDAGNTEIAWDLGGTPTSPEFASYDGLIVLSPVNIKLWTTITVNFATYINAKMYVGGTLNYGSWSGYYGDTTTNADKMYITY